ncbi:DUF1345 domain-containing protein [Sanguibacter sp. HDW7]|uniref:DUF1345 domain-containing protein n=1 Tax=Sanguibacter sp. HDW7 TaxID=2714931 RepID=UPI0014090CAC|nr:DUF1345 domain-containing protein [Sanguibacter sp. HDW7]QIK83894.1 DUF1345 domain-containing protein [Sanguibacter sp. HDW7]
MPRIRRSRDIPLRFDDGFRGAVSMLVAAPLAVAAAVVVVHDAGGLGPALAWMCGAFTVFFGVYIVWTHLLHDRADAQRVERIAAVQHRRGASALSRMLGLRSAEEWGVSAAATALVISIAAAIVGARDGGLLLPVLVLVTVAMTWASVVYAFALRYLRLHAAGETIDFGLDEPPGFSEFLSMAVMVSAVGALSGGTPRTRAGLTAVRVQTIVAFAFNALVVAMAVSLMTGLVTGA